MRDLINGLVSRYVATLPERRARIRSAVAMLANGRTDGRDWRQAPALEDLRAEAHRLSGSAGTMGLDALGRAAGALDVFLALVSAEVPEAAEGDWQQLVLLHRQLDDLLAQPSGADAREAERAGGRVLVVSSDPVLQGLVEYLLEAVGIDVFVRDAAALEKVRPGVVVVDRPEKAAEIEPPGTPVLVVRRPVDPEEFLRRVREALPG